MSTDDPILIQSIRDVTIAELTEHRINDMVQIQQIGELLYDLVDRQNRSKLVLDFSKVRILSSAVLGVLTTLQKMAKERKGEVVICSMGKEIRHVFKISRLDRIFRFCDTEEEALAVFGVTTAG